MSSLPITVHDALILPSAGTAPHIAPVTISPDVHHREHPYPRSVDLHPYNDLIHVYDLNLEGAQYFMFYALAPSLPVNRSVLAILRMQSLPVERLIYRGDVVIVRCQGPSEEDVCDRCYGHVSISLLPFVTARIQELWKQHTLESRFAQMRRLAANPGARRQMTDSEYDKLVREVQEIEVAL